MKNNSSPSQISFKKQSHQRYNTPLSFLSKNKTRSTQTSPQKYNGYFDTQRHQSHHMISLNHFQIPQESSSTLDQLDTNKSINLQTKPSTTYHLSPPRINSNDKFTPQTYSSRQPYASLNSSTMQSIQSIPLRSTLRNLQKSSQKHQHQTEAPCSNQSGTHSFNFTIHHKSIKKCITNEQLVNENKRLKQQNLQLRQQLQQIKKNIIYQVCNKNQQTILSLQQALFRKEQETKNIKAILEQQINQNTSLLRQIQAKNDQISVLSFDISQLHEQIAECKQKYQRYDKLKSKISLIFKMYKCLQEQSLASTNEWSDFVERWQQQKGMYLHRISFLEGYIANN